MFTSIIKIRKGWKYCREVLAHGVQAVGPLGWSKIGKTGGCQHCNIDQVAEWVCVFESLPAMCPLHFSLFLLEPIPPVWPQYPHVEIFCMLATKEAVCEHM